MPLGIGFAAGVIGTIVVMSRGEYLMAWMLPILLLFAGVFTFAFRRLRVGLEAGTLTIAAGFNTRRVAVGDLDLDGARIVDLRERTEFKPMLKTMGTALPGYATGHFRLRNRSKAFLMLTDRTRVLVLPEKSGRTLLLSLQQPQALLDALRRKGN
ncbi:PH domain-containing protein [Luteimonas sp. SX5]|uniref:PH domain-containing protein n=1 Tax=Luteimonas galliterrae TaxID=2940486 RepID=A0ABT0MGX2_9GAMM|nr:PH domain-containing protein [Luteimonas galliterrae]MCL1634117.1 PH domain-containing protein [Luteimonas galliterrae]